MMSDDGSNKQLAGITLVVFVVLFLLGAVLEYNVFG